MSSVPCMICLPSLILLLALSQVHLALCAVTYSVPCVECKYPEVELCDELIFAGLIALRIVPGIQQVGNKYWVEELGKLSVR